MICNEIIPDYIGEDIPDDDNDSKASESFGNDSNDDNNGDVMFDSNGNDDNDDNIDDSKDSNDDGDDNNDYSNDNDNNNQKMNTLITVHISWSDLDLVLCWQIELKMFFGYHCHLAIILQ